MNLYPKKLTTKEFCIQQVAMLIIFSWLAMCFIPVNHIHARFLSVCAAHFLVNILFNRNQFLKEPEEKEKDDYTVIAEHLGLPVIERSYKNPVKVGPLPGVYTYFFNNPGGGNIQVQGNDMYIRASNSYWHIYKGGITMLDGTPAKISDIEDIVMFYYKLNPKDKSAPSVTGLTAREILEKEEMIFKTGNEFGDEYVEQGYGPESVEACMKIYAEQERKKAFEAAINSIVAERKAMHMNYDDYAKENPLP